jgi:hypothetical protein
MGLMNLESGLAEEPPHPAVRPRRHSRFVPELETEIGQLYLETMEEPVPLRLLTILRAGVCRSKA